MTARPIVARALATVRSKHLGLAERWNGYSRPASNGTISPTLLVLHRLQYSNVPGGDRPTGHSKIPAEHHETGERVDRDKIVPPQDKTEAQPAKPTVEETDLDNVDTKNMTMWEYLRYMRDRVKQLWKRYGMVAFGTYWVLYIGGFGGVYALLASGIVDHGVDTSHVLQQLSEWSGADSNPTVSGYVKRLQHLVQTNPQAERAVVALVVNEIIELPREVLVFFVTPSIARALGRAPARKTNKADQ